MSFTHSKSSHPAQKVFIYAPDEHIVLHLFEEKQQQELVHLEIKNSALTFVLKGSLRMTSADSPPQTVEAGHFFLLPTGNDFYGKALTDTVVLACSISNNNTSNYDHLIKGLIHQYLDPEAAVETGPKAIPTLPIHNLLRQELEGTIQLLKTVDSSLNYQQSKRDLIMMLLFRFYETSDLARLFQPVLNENFEFIISILNLYHEVKNVKEIIARSNIPNSTFNRRFKQIFHVSIGEWLTLKKKKDIYNELRFSDIPLNALAEKYDFTPNHLNKFCKKHFQASPSDVREQYYTSHNGL